ncbi:MAG: response regulator [Rhodobacteraceae bacterium]|nr:response regulator [Paracoccaceae bacterium]
MTFSEPIPDADSPVDMAKVDLALLGHDLRSAVSDILGGLRLIPADGLDPKVQQHLERVRVASELMAGLVEEGLSLLMEPQGIGATPAGPVPLSRLVNDIVARWRGRAEEKNLLFQVSLGKDLPPTLAIDRIALDRILSNILSNAIKYSTTGTVSFAMNLAPNGILRLSVSDQGPGFSAEAMACLFKRGGRPAGATEPGHGLGMHITRDLTGRLGGTITVENRLEGGACVTLDLPPASWITADEPPPRTALPDLAGKRVLVADDSATNQAILCQMMMRMGAQPVIAHDGIAALERLMQEQFDLALIDIEMPRLSGLEVISRLRASGMSQRDLPIIAITAYVLRSNRDAIVTAGADMVLAKPLDGIEPLGAAIASLLAGAPHSSLPADGQNTPLPRLEAMLAMAGPKAAAEILTRFRSDLRNVERDLLNGFARNDDKLVQSCTHILISLAGLAGAESLLILAQKLNACAQAGDLIPKDDLLGQTLAQLDQLITQAEKLPSRQENT